MRLDPEKVRRARESLGYSIEATGEVAEISPNSVLRAEHGEEIRPSTARRLARALNTEVAELYPKVEAPSSFPTPEISDEARHKVEAETEAALDEEEELYALTLEELGELHASLEARRDAVALAIARKARGWTEEPHSAKQRQRREAREVANQADAEVG